MGPPALVGTAVGSLPTVGMMVGEAVGRGLDTSDAADDVPGGHTVGPPDREIVGLKVGCGTVGMHVGVGLGWAA